ncbi:hypothetical protein [Paenibacillus koleovorans]|uniref:hypothetical protein n=1 Tax=Paenibacillus koleovorans TaxID=121608 RepID=UPI000FDAA72D|nr:hypothetical protein [Paenibacillus koleovorans]
MADEVRIVLGILVSFFTIAQQTSCFGVRSGLSADSLFVLKMKRNIVCKGLRRGRNPLSVRRIVMLPSMHFICDARLYSSMCSFHL